MHQANDRTAKWLVDRHGDSILFLAGITGFVRWQPVPAETIAPRRLPDGLLQVWFPEQNQPDLVLIEIETYPGKDVDRQVFEDMEAVHLNRGAIPEVACLVLKPKGKLAVTGTATRTSRRGTATMTARWPVVNLWEVDAEELLAQGDPGLIPWVTLAKSNRNRAEVLTECRDRLNALPDTVQRSNLLSVTAILAGLANDPEALLNLFGGPEMIESPVLDLLIEHALKKERAKAEATLQQEREKVQSLQREREESRVTMLIAVLEARFGSVPPELQSELRQTRDAELLEPLVRLAATCPDLAAFSAGLPRSS